jgi:hypothetical protein
MIENELVLTKNPQGKIAKSTIMVGEFQHISQ